MRIADICPTCATYTNAVCVIYNAKYLTNINVSPLDNLQDILGSINDNLVPIVDTGVPSVTAVYVGQLYVNSTSGTMYYANSIAGGGGSWTQLAPSSAIPTTPSLNAVLAVGNTSTYSINIQNLLVAPTTITTITPGGIGIGDATGAINIGTSVISVYDTGVINNIDIDGITGSIRITTGGGTGEILATNLSGNQTFQLPDQSGTIALLSDIPTPPTALYKSYVGRITQVGVTAPAVPFLFENTLINPVTFTYNSPGNYTLNCLDIINTKTVVFIQIGASGLSAGPFTKVVNALTGISSIDIVTINTSTSLPQDNLLEGYIEIRVYP